MIQIILEQINEINKFYVGKNISYIKYDYTEDNSLFTQIGINDGSVYLEIFFDPEIKKVLDVNLVIYEKKKRKFTYSGTMEDCLKQIV